MKYSVKIWRTNASALSAADACSKISWTRISHVDGRLETSVIRLIICRLGMSAAGGAVIGTIITIPIQFMVGKVCT